jgi:hypothetical protein
MVKRDRLLTRAAAVVLRQAFMKAGKISTALAARTTPGFLEWRMPLFHGLVVRTSQLFD